MFFRKLINFFKKDYVLHRLYKHLLARFIQKAKNTIIQRNSEADLAYGLFTGAEREEKIIISLTSFPKRLPTLHICLKSLLLQDEKPDRIIVWFGEDVTEDMITKEMLQLKEYGIEYRFVTGNLKPHKKYFYAMQEFPDAVVITVDDDVIYSSNMIRSLMKSHKSNPGSVCARRVHVMYKDSNNNLLPYDTWKLECRSGKKPSMSLFATGVGGVLYPPYCLHKDAFDEEKIIDYCLEADDVWLKFMELRNNTPVVRVPCLVAVPPSISGTQEFALCNTNVNYGKNDVYISNMVSMYPDSTNLIKTKRGGYAHNE